MLLNQNSNLRASKQEMKTKYWVMAAERSEVPVLRDLLRISFAANSFPPHWQAEVHLKP
jgi:hypothetical protein